MRSPVSALLLALVLAAFPLPASGGTLALVGATVFDATGAPPIADAVVVVDGDRIAAVGPRDQVTIPDDAEIIDVSGRFVVPGLVDPHIHFFQSGGLYTRPDIVDLRDVRSYESEQAGIQARMDDTFRRYLASGVTAVVDVGGPMWNFDVRDQARESEFAPRVAVAGPLISTVDRPQLDLGDPPIIRAESRRHATKLVRGQLKRKPDLIKVWFILPESGDPTENLPILKTVIRQAHRKKKRVAVHATQLRTAQVAVDAGADILVHSIDDEPVDEDFIRAMKKGDVLLTTTLVVYEGYGEVLGRDVKLLDIERRLGDPAVIASWGELETPVVSDHVPAEKSAARVEKMLARREITHANLRALMDAGVAVHPGTDAGNIGTVHGPSVHREFQLWIEAGMTPEQTLIGATREAARVFAAEPEFGTVEPGKLADLLVLDADPLADVANLQAIHRVVLGGRVLDPEEILPPGAEAVVQRQVEAYNARDIDAFLSFYSDDVVIERAPGGKVLHGSRESMRKGYQALFDASPELHCHILQRTVSGDVVIDHEFVTGARGGDAIRAVAVYEVADGKIRRVIFLPREE
jgi:imidazolonepropionase-like amidohydrolase